MPNIFDGVRNMSDDEIRLEIALFTQTNLLNAARETGNRVVNGIAGLANSLFQSFGSTRPLDYQAVRVPDMVNEQADQLAGLSRTELVLRLKRLIASKCGVPEEESGITGDDRLSYLAVNEAAKLYNIAKYATPANKIEQVCIHYNKAFLVSLHQCIVRQREDEIQEFDRKLQKRIDEISIEDKRELHKRLMPKEFSGRGIGRILRLERGTKYLEQTIIILGVHTFDEASVHVAAAVGAIKNMKRISQSLMAQLVWKCAASYGGSFRVNVSSLPSYTADGTEDEQKKDDDEFRELLSSTAALRARITGCEKLMDRVDEQVSKTGEKLHGERERLVNAREAFDRLASQKDEYSNRLHTENETKNYYSRVNEASRRLEQLETSVDRLEKKLGELDTQSGDCETELKAVRTELEAAEVKSDEKLSELSENLMNKWTAFFFRFTFDRGVFEQAVLELDLGERLTVEEMLKELHESSDAGAFDTSLSSGEIICGLLNKKNAVIFHEKRKITKIIKQG